MALLAEWSGSNQTDTGLPSDQYRRAVLRAPPSRFVVEFLPIIKTNSSYHHGMRISPLYVPGSVSSRSTTSEYEIWRRWEDCLWFLDSLQTEYKRAAKEKRTRLAQGKGVKGFNGLYKQDFASSWESLPPGPDPNSVAQDIHQVLPRLTKKGTIFRPTMATIEARHAEMQKLVEALFSDEMPALIKEIRATTVVTDFFGLWRRDFDHLEKSNTRNSLSYSVFSSYFSASNPSLASSNAPSISASPTKLSVRSISSDRPRTRSTASETPSTHRSRSSRSRKRLSAESDNTTSTYKPRRALSVVSSGSSSTHSGGSDGSQDTISTPSSPIGDLPFLRDCPLTPGERPNSILEVLPEEREMLSKSPEKYLSSAGQTRPRASTPERKMNRTRQVVGTSERKRSSLEEPLDHKSIRESWQSTASVDTASDYLEGLNLSLPNKIKEHKFRASLASISTFMTTDSADAIISRTSSDEHRRPRMSTPLSISDFDICSDDGDNSSILDSFPRPLSSFPERPETPTNRDFPYSPDSFQSSFEMPPSPTTSTVSSAYTAMTETNAAASATLNIKVAHNDSIVMLRISRGISYEELRQKIYNKFVGQEGIPLCDNFAIAFVLASPARLSQGSSKSPSSPASFTSRNRGSIKVINNDLEWEKLIMTTSTGKINLRLFDSPLPSLS